MIADSEANRSLTRVYGASGGSASPIELNMECARAHRLPGLAASLGGEVKSYSQAILQRQHGATKSALQSNSRVQGY
jgi:hypothetical protein